MKTRPNILYIFADQLRPQSCGYFGDTKARTPNIDRIAHEGINFANATSMHPVCGPHRASLFTGCYSSSTGYVINELRARTDLPTFAEALNSLGYCSEYIGKWHLWASEAKDLKTFHQKPENQFVPPGPDRLGFDDYWAAYNFNHDYYEGFYYRDDARRIELDGYEPDLMTDIAIERLRKAAASSQPLSLFVSYGTPHQPWNWDNVPDEWAKSFRDEDFPLPQNYEPGSGEYWHRWFDRAWWDNNVAPKLSVWQAIYYAMTANLDWNVGRLLDALDELGLADNTIVVFTSDHGEMFGAHGRVQKNIFWDEALRVPFLIRWPGRVPAGATSDVCLNTPDIMPTLLSLAGAEIPSSVEGVDLSAACLGGTCVVEPDAAFCQGMGPSVDWDDGFEWRAVRNKRYTYAVLRQDRQEFLFDNISDPLQTRNLVGQPGHAEVRGKLSRWMQQKMTNLGDTFQAVTWYRDQWIDDGAIISSAKDLPNKPDAGEGK